MKLSLIISTYNSPEALRATLASVLRQAIYPREIIIADDGSDESTATVIKEFTSKSPVPLRHVWHENRGFRLAAIRNRAIAAATGDYIVQIDGDIILDPFFIADHIDSARNGHFVCGSRVQLGESLSKQITANPSLSPSPWTKGVVNHIQAMRSGFLSAVARHLCARKLTYSGCNMAFWRSDLLAVNGYDESYTGWGCEDSDLVARLLFHRITPLKASHCAICYHLWHPSPKKDDTFVRNNRLLEETRRNRHIRANEGLDKYLDEEVTIPH